MTGRLRPEVDERWAASTVVTLLVESVLAWLEDGDPAADAELVDRMGAATRAVIRSWSPAPEP